MFSPILDALIISIVINLFVFIFAFKNQTDHYTDITYCLTFILLAGIYFIQGDISELSRIILFVMITLWGLRLGLYLRKRIKVIGVDHRFDVMRPNWKRYMRFWIIQGTSVWLISLPVIHYLSVTAEPNNVSTLSFIQGIGIGIWAFGFLMETIADNQKFNFRNNKANEGQFMNQGLFSIIRFPNYLGEILVWIGVFIFVIPTLTGMSWTVILSPLWICFLLLGLSGIPMLTRQSDKRYGHLQSYHDYKAKTKKLIPSIF